MRNAYPIFIAEYNTDYLVYVPDLDIYTEGKDIPDAMAMARDAIGLAGISYEDINQVLPAPSSIETVIQKAKRNSDIFDYTQGICTLVDVDFTEYRKRLQNRSVKKNCTIPYWLNVEAERQGINFSKILQEALINTLGLNN